MLCYRVAKDQKGNPLMADHKHGEMNIAEQQKTFGAFIQWGIWLSVIVAVILIFLAIVGI